MNTNVGERSPLAIDRDRVSVLLLINTQLFKRAIHTYNTILINLQVLSKMSLPERQKTVESYQHYTRRIHGNLQVLTYIHEKYHLAEGAQQTSKTPFPLYITAPPDMPELNGLYLKLAELYPEAVQFARMKGQQVKGPESVGRSSQGSVQGSVPPSQGYNRADMPMNKGNGVPNGGNNMHRNGVNGNMMNNMPQNSMPPQGPGYGNVNMNMNDMNVGQMNQMNMNQNQMNMNPNMNQNINQNLSQPHMNQPHMNQNQPNQMNQQFQPQMNMNNMMGMSPANTMSSMNSPMVTNMMPNQMNNFNGQYSNKSMPMNNMNMPQNPTPQNTQPPPSNPRNSDPSIQPSGNMNQQFYNMNDGSPGMLDFFN